MSSSETSSRNNLTVNQHSNPGIDHPCLVRKSARTYELLNPDDPADTTSFDVGQVKQFVLFDAYLRAHAGQQIARVPIPSAYEQFAARFNQYAKGQERFASFVLDSDRSLVVSKDGEPIVWDHFLIDDDLVGWERPESVTSSAASEDGADAFVVVDNPVAAVEAAGRRKDELQAKVEARMELIGEMGDFYNAWAMAEYSHANNLKTLSETLKAKDETGALRAVITTVQKEILSQSKFHKDAADNIRTKSLVDLADIARKHRSLFNDDLVDHSSGFDMISDEADEEVKNKLDLDKVELKVQKMELSRRDFLKDAFWAYANAVSTVCVAEDEACERIRMGLEAFDATASDSASATSPDTIQHKTGDTTTTVDAPGGVSSASSNVSSGNNTTSNSALNSASPAIPSDPLPQPPLLSPPLFYVKALYDYTGVDPKEFDFKAGDIISVTATTDDGWWSGEHVAIGKNVVGKTVFPSNFFALYSGPLPYNVLNTTPETTPSALAASSSAADTLLSALGLSSMSQPSTAQIPSNGKRSLPKRDPKPALPQPPIQFCVKALYKYEGKGVTDMSFEEGDIIGIYAMEEDGWWLGELMDEKRRVPGRFSLPSNFVERLD